MIRAAGFTKLRKRPLMLCRPFCASWRKSAKTALASLVGANSPHATRALTGVACQGNGEAPQLVKGTLLAVSVSIPFLSDRLGTTW